MRKLFVPQITLILASLNLYKSGTRRDIEKRSVAFLSVLNGLSCDTLKRQPKISFHRHFNNAPEWPLLSQKVDRVSQIPRTFSFLIASFRISPAYCLVLSTKSAPTSFKEDQASFKSREGGLQILISIKGYAKTQKFRSIEAMKLFLWPFENR